MSTSNGTPARQPKGIPTGGQFAASAHAEAAVVLATNSDEDSAADYMAFMEQNQPDPNDAWKGDCAKCGAAMIDDPAGSTGVLVHADENGHPDYDADEDHAPVPEDAVPDLGLTGLMDAENARNGAWEPGQQSARDLTGGAFDAESGRCHQCDGHYKHDATCPTLKQADLTDDTADPDPDVAVAADAAAEAARLLEAYGEDAPEFTVEMGYEMNRSRAVANLDAFEAGHLDPSELAFTAIALGSSLGASGSPAAATDENADPAHISAERLREALERAVEGGHRPDDVAALAKRVRESVEEGDRSIRTFQGRTARQWRQEAADSRKRSADSFARSDTDGYLSQWASDITAREKDAKADLAEQGGYAEFPALLDLDNNPVPARLINSKFGMSWMFLDEDGNSTGDFLSLSKARSAERRNAFYERKGFRTARVRVPATVRMTDAMMPSPYFARTDRGFDANAEITEIGETEDWD